MTAEPETVSLREHLTMQISALRDRLDALRAADQVALVAALTSADKAVHAALDASKEAVAKAEMSVARQLTLLNELRSGVATEAQLAALADKLDGVRKFQFLITGMGVVLSIAIPVAVSLLLRK